jgi:phosphatidylglycerol:prolipoprotein diacylglycerol transferase
MFIVPFAVLCARLYYCIFEWESYQDNLLRIFYIWEGGLAIYGGVIGAAIGIIVFSKVKKVNVGAVLDITSLGFLIGQSLGRWGNFFNREAFGAETESFLRMGLYKRVLENGNIINSNTMYFYHPTFLYESLWNAAGFALLHYLSKKRSYDGQVALMYVAWYGLGRTFIEGLRLDSLYIGSIRVSQLLAAVSCFAAVALLMYFGFFKQPDPKKMQVYRLQAQEAKQEKEDTSK